MKYTVKPKVCPTCKTMEHEKVGRGNQCRPCFNNYVRLRTYGLTKDTFLAMLDAQGNVCKICKVAIDGGTDTHIDHCHDTKNVRGLLCRHCNIGLGQFKDNVNALLQACHYLQDSQLEEDLK